jgi:hypothetical protein
MGSSIAGSQVLGEGTRFKIEVTTINHIRRVRDRSDWTWVISHDWRRSDYSKWPTLGSGYGSLAKIAFPPGSSYKTAEKCEY